MPLACYASIFITKSLAVAARVNPLISICDRRVREIALRINFKIHRLVVVNIDFALLLCP